MPKRHIIRMEPNLDLGPIIRAPVSPAVRVNGFIFTSGYVAINAETRKLDPGSAATVYGSGSVVAPDDP